MSGMDCPACKGTGKIDPPKNLHKRLFGTAEREAMLAMRESGYTLREIGKQFGIESAQRVQHFIFTVS